MDYKEVIAYITKSLTKQGKEIPIILSELPEKTEQDIQIKAYLLVHSCYKYVPDTEDKLLMRTLLTLDKSKLFEV